MEKLFRKVKCEERMPPKEGSYMTNMGSLFLQEIPQNIGLESGLKWGFGNTPKWWLEEISYTKFIEDVRQAFADYRRAEGCSCCRSIDLHEEAEKRLGKLLVVKPYDDGSGFDWSLYYSMK